MSVYFDFTGIPNNTKVPFTAVTFDGDIDFNTENKILIIGSVPSTSTLEEGKVIQVLSSNIESTLGGGSMAGRMAQAVRDQGALNSMYVYVIKDVGTAAKWSVTFNGSVTTDGYITLGVNGEAYRVRAQIGDTLDDLAGDLADLITADESAEVTAVATAGVVELTSVAENAETNSFTISDRTTNSSTSTTGVTLEIAQTVQGAINPECDDVFDYIANYGAGLKFVALGFNDEYNLALADEFYSSAYPTGVNNPMAKNYGCCFTTIKDTILNRIGAGEERNNEYLCIHSVSENWQDSSYSTLGGVVGIQALWKSAVPTLSRPTTNIELQNINGYINENNDEDDTFEDQAALLDAGLSTIIMNANNNPALSRAITTKKYADSGARSDTWLDLNVPYQLFYVAEYLNATLSEKFANCAITDSANSNYPIIVNASDIQREVEECLNYLEDVYIIESADEAIDALIVQRSADNENCVEIYFNCDLVNPLYQLKVLVGFER